MKASRLTALLSVAIAALAPAAFAAPVTYDITGTVSSGSGIYSGDLYDAVTAVFTEDLSQQGSSLTAYNGNGSASFLAIQIYVNGHDIAPQLAAGDSFYEYISSSAASVSNGEYSSFQANVYDFTNGFTAVSYSASAPGNGAYSANGSVPLPSSPSYVGRGDIQTSGGQLELHVQSIAVAPPVTQRVPAPLSLGLLGFGLIGAAFSRRRALA